MPLVERADMVHLKHEFSSENNINIIRLSVDWLTLLIEGGVNWLQMGGREKNIICIHKIL